MPAVNHKQATASLQAHASVTEVTLDLPTVPVPRRDIPILQPRAKDRRNQIKSPVSPSSQTVQLHSSAMLGLLGAHSSDLPGNSQDELLSFAPHHPESP